MYFATFYYLLSVLNNSRMNRSVLSVYGSSPCCCGIPVCLQPPIFDGQERRYGASANFWCQQRQQLYGISGFRREIEENCALQSYCAASNGNFLPMFRHNLPVPSSAITTPCVITQKSAVLNNSSSCCRIQKVCMLKYNTIVVIFSL